jgi:hypothetical protein
MEETTYKGYRVKYHCTVNWFALAWAPGSTRVWTAPPIATREEGREILEKRTKDRIDWETASDGRPNSN